MGPNLEIGWNPWGMLPHSLPQEDYAEEAATTETSSWATAPRF